MDAKLNNLRILRIEKIERITLPRGFTKFCEQCKRETIFVSVEQAVFNFNLSAREIFRLIEANKVHFYESAAGSMFVCANSLEDLQEETTITKKILVYGESL